MKNLRRLAAAILAAHVAAVPACAASGYKALAKDLSKASRKAGLLRVAVIPFSAADGSEPADGQRIAEKLVTQLVRRGEVGVVERRMLRKLLDEHALAGTGLLDQAGLKKLGKVLSVDGIVTGSFSEAFEGLVIDARLIDVETGLIVAAGEETVAKDWAASASWPVAVPDFALAAPAPGREDLFELRDAPADLECSNAAGRVDALEASILDLKARYWAGQLKKGRGLSEAKVNPGSTITDPELKTRFYSLLKSYYSNNDVPALSSDEVRRFVSQDEKAFRLHHDCGI